MSRMDQRLRKCMECDELATLTTGAEVYPHRLDLHQKAMWLCVCGAYVGCHPGTTVPLGYPAGPETRDARQAAHRAFDPLWKSGNMTRKEAYHWLAQRMGRPASETHISWMNAEEARQVVSHCLFGGMGEEP